MAQIAQNRPARLCILILCGALGGISGSVPALALTKAEARAAYSAAEALRDTDALAAFDAMARLSDAGDGRATSRLAYYTLRGIGTPEDPARAAALYEKAVQQGHTRSKLSRAKVLMMQGQGEIAAPLFEEAVADQIQGAPAEAAAAHALSRLGALSRPEAGWRDLQALAQAGDPSAELTLLRVAARRQQVALADAAALLARVHARAEEGEGRAAEALLPYLRGPGRASTGSLAVRQAMTTHPGVRPQVSVTEQLYLAAELQPHRFWRAAEEIVHGAAPAARERGVVVTAKINRNAYLWVVEPHLQALGYDLRGRRGYLNRSHIRALNAVCRSAGASVDCRQGPLKSVSIKRVAERLFGS
ncbi:MAG: SEL1-like repeat protein [Pseudomonadota bacterium]